MKFLGLKKESGRKRSEEYVVDWFGDRTCDFRGVVRHDHERAGQKQALATNNVLDHGLKMTAVAQKARSSGPFLIAQGFKHRTLCLLTKN